MQHLFSLPSLLLTSFFSAVLSTTFTVTNNCAYTIWPGVLSNAGSTPLSNVTGFALAPGESRVLPAPGESRVLPAPVPWSGRLWARTLCSADPATGRFSCATGDCGSGAIDCNGAGAAPPATLAEFTLGGAGDTDFYDVSLVDGYNLPVLVAAGGCGGCPATGCAADVNAVCPAELRVAAADGRAVACRSACEAFGAARYCCSGEFASPSACGPTSYSQVFKTACPRAYSYAFDDATSTFTCPTAVAAGCGYTVTFCPSATGLTSKGGDEHNPEAAGGLPPQINDTMVFSGVTHIRGGGVNAIFSFLNLAAWLYLSSS